MKGLRPTMLAIAALGLSAAMARAADTVTVGAIYRLTGAAASSNSRAAIDTAAEIVNSPHPGLETLPLGAGQGLPNLGGAKIAVSFGDDLGNVSVAQAQALRLIGRERVAALIGAGASGPTMGASAVAERRGVPFLVPDAETSDITGRGFKFLFRTTPLGADFANEYMRFLAELKAGGTKIETIGLLYEWDDPGKAKAALLRDAAKAAGFTIAPELGYGPGGTNLSVVVPAVKSANPDALIAIGDATDARLLVTTMNTLGYKPPVLIGDDFGFSDPGFVTSTGNLAQGLIDRSIWSLGKPGSAAAIANGLYKAKSGRDLDDASARVLQGFLVLADAINRAGSTDPAAIRTALRDTDLKPGQVIVGYDGVKFDDNGQNALAATYLTQLQGKQYVPVWPAESTDGKLVLPYKGWQ
jgi:branched-chain amino acid transport system substrate-binding protein